MNVKLLTKHHLEFLSLKGGCTGSSGSTLVKMPHCWKSHAMAHIYDIDPFTRLRYFMFGTQKHDATDVSVSLSNTCIYGIVLGENQTFVSANSYSSSF